MLPAELRELASVHRGDNVAHLPQPQRYFCRQARIERRPNREPEKSGTVLTRFTPESATIFPDEIVYDSADAGHRARRRRVGPSRLRLAVSDRPGPVRGELLQRRAG